MFNLARFICRRAVNDIKYATVKQVKFTTAKMSSISKNDALFFDSFGDDSASSSPREGEFYNLQAGSPRLSHIVRSSEIIKEASKQLFSKQSLAEDALQYGARQGGATFRTEVAKFLSEQYNDQVLPGHIMQTGGATHGLVLATLMLLRANATIYVEDPTYFLAINVLKHDMERNLVAVPVDDDGIRVDELEKLIAAQSGSTVPGAFSNMVYIVPTFSNPRARSYSPERSRELVAMARRHNVLIFCDDVYNMMHYTGDKYAPPRLLSYDDKSDPDYKGNVISNGTFSKILAPGVRVGWIEAGPRIIDAVSKSFIVESSGAVNHTMGLIIAEALRSQLQQRHLDVLRSDLRRVVTGLSDILRSQLPPGCKFYQPQGGYFVWIELPAGADTKDLVEIAQKEHQLIIRPGNVCSLTKSFPNFVRMTFAYLEEEAQLEGTRRLCAAITSYLSRLQAGPKL